MNSSSNPPFCHSFCHISVVFGPKYWQRASVTPFWHLTKGDAALMLLLLCLGWVPFCMIWLPSDSERPPLRTNKTNKKPRR